MIAIQTDSKAEFDDVAVLHRVGLAFEKAMRSVPLAAGSGGAPVKAEKSERLPDWASPTMQIIIVAFLQGIVRMKKRRVDYSGIIAFS